MPGLPGIKGWRCNIAIEGMPFDGVEILEVSNAGVIINEKGVEKFIPWAAIRVITKTGIIEAAVAEDTDEEAVLKDLINHTCL